MDEQRPLGYLTEDMGLLWGTRGPGQSSCMRREGGLCQVLGRRGQAPPGSQPLQASPEALPAKEGPGHPCVPPPHNC